MRRDFTEPELEYFPIVVGDILTASKETDPEDDWGDLHF